MYRSQRVLSVFFISCLGTLPAQPAAAVTLAGGVYPFAVGDTFVYTVTKTETTSSATGIRVATTSEPFAETTVIGAATTYDGKKAYPYTTTASYASAGTAVTIHDVEYRNFVTVGKELYDSDYGYVDADTSLATGKKLLRLNVNRTYGALEALSPYLFDILPRPASWGEPVALDETTNDYYDVSAPNNNVLQSHLVRASDGSLRDSGLSYDVPFSAVLNSNGTGYSSAGPAQGGTTWTYGVAQPGDKGYVIPATETYDSKTHTNLVPDWYPGHKLAPKPLATSVMRVGTAKVPKGCGEAAGEPATELVATYAQVNPAQAFTYDETDDYFVIAGLGRVCHTQHIVETIYDSKVSGDITSVTTTNWEYGLSSEKLH
jgi:hypothetical protein